MIINKSFEILATSLISCETILFKVMLTSDSLIIDALIGAQCDRWRIDSWCTGNIRKRRHVANHTTWKFSIRNRVEQDAVYEMSCLSSRGWRRVCVLHSGLESSRRVNWLNYLGWRFAPSNWFQWIFIRYRLAAWKEHSRRFS